MASTDAKPIPTKNTAYRVTFAIYDNDGDLVSTADETDTTVEVSKDGAAFVDATNHMVEIGASGTYYLDLTASEMNADTVVVLVTPSITDSKPTPIVLYPQDDVTYANNPFAAAAVLALEELLLQYLVRDEVGTDGLTPILGSGSIIDRMLSKDKNRTYNQLSDSHEGIVDGAATTGQISQANWEYATRELTSAKNIKDTFDEAFGKHFEEATEAIARCQVVADTDNSTLQVKAVDPVDTDGLPTLDNTFRGRIMIFARSATIRYCYAKIDGYNGTTGVFTLNSNTPLPQAPEPGDWFAVL